MHQPVSGERGENISRSRLSIFKKIRLPPINLKFILIIIRILAGLALLILAVQGIQYKNLAAGISSANIVWLAPVFFSVLTGLFLKLWRWAIFLKNYRIQTSMARVFSAYFAGQAVNILLPLRSGELVRVGYFADQTKILPEIVTTIALEKYLDLIALVLCCILVSFKLSLDNILNLRGILLPVSVILTLVLLVAIFLGPTLWQKIRDRNLLPERLTVWLDRWLQASQWLRNPRRVFPGVLLTLLIWGIMWLTNLLLFHSLGMPLGGTASGLVLISVYVGLLPALMPGNIGPFYFFASMALIPFGIIHDQALTFAVILHAIVTLPALLGGAIGLLIRPGRMIAS